MTASRVVRNPTLDSHRRALVGASGASPTHGGVVGAPTIVASSKQGGFDVDPASQEIAKGYEDGHAEGLRRGLAEAQASIDRELETRWQSHKAQFEQAERRRAEEHGQRIEALGTILQTIQKALPERFMALERQAIELAYEALCRVCGPHADQEAGADRAGLLADLVRQGMGQLRGQALLGIRLNPLDYSVLTGSDTGKALLSRFPEVRFVSDAALEPLGCVVESDHGQLDVSLMTQLGRLRDLWAQAASGREDAEGLGAAGGA